MPLNVQGVSGTRYTFEGPYNNTDPLKNRSGVYVIACDDERNSKGAIDVGESSEVKDRVEKHGRDTCWSEKCSGTLKVAVLYTPNKQEASRKEIEQDIRDNFRNLCGDR